ncbi:hypothetical protein COO60DRAFT_651093 [Scenedesmus sp. NREL 46B-D3]|nr:hypothetical protein COO60DRAFT_651093 [Scenedesmus sp. NREL 46B-D3]
MSGYSGKADRLLQEELDRDDRGEVSFKGPKEGSLASNNRKPEKQQCSSRVEADPLAAMEQLVQEDLAVYGTACLPERSSAAGSSSYSFCPCPGQHGSTIPTQQRQQQQQQQQDSAGWAEPEDDRMQELLQADLRKLQRRHAAVQMTAAPSTGCCRSVLCRSSASRLLWWGSQVRLLQSLLPLQLLRCWAVAKLGGLPADMGCTLPPWTLPARHMSTR